MRSVSAIIILNLACVYGWNWNTFIPTMHFDRFPGLPNNDDIRSIDSSNVTTHYIHLPLDHFNSSEKRTIKIYYKQNLNFWQPDGPIYIWPLRERFLEPINYINKNDTFIFALAKETKGAMFLFQERYYTPSTPTIPKSEDKNYWNYLSTKQQLADIAEFIKYLKSKPEFQLSKVVLMGLRVEGSHATWMRAVYPNLVDAAVAVSAPLLAKKDAKEILEFTADLYDKYGHEGCINEIEKRFQEFTDTLNNKTAIDEFNHKHDICAYMNFTEINDQRLYMNGRYEDYTDYASFGNLKGIKHCKANYEAVGINRSRSWKCNAFHYETKMEDVQHWNKYLVKWYQECTEYGRAATSSAEKRPFVHYSPLEFHLLWCKDLWGVDEKRLDEGIAQTNLLYGGLTPNVTNVVFTQGELNPYKLLGVQQNLSDSAPAFEVKEDGVFNIMFYEENESTDRTEVRNRVRTLIKKWIGL